MTVELEREAAVVAACRAYNAVLLNQPEDNRDQPEAMRAALDAIAAWNTRPQSQAAGVDEGRAFYLAMYEGDGGKWEAVDERHHPVWIKKARRFLALLPQPSPEGESRRWGSEMASNVKLTLSRLRAMEAALAAMLAGMEGEGDWPEDVSRNDMEAAERWVWQQIAEREGRRARLSNERREP